MQDTPASLSPQDALVAVMIAVSASDENMRTSELVAIQQTVNYMPVFGGYDADRIGVVANTADTREACQCSSASAKAP